MTSLAPHSARDLPEVPAECDEALNEVVTAVCGFPYPGDRIDAVMHTIRVLRAYPSLAQGLGIGGAP